MGGGEAAYNLKISDIGRPDHQPASPNVKLLQKKPRGSMRGLKESFETPPEITAAAVSMTLDPAKSLDQHLDTTASR